MFRVICLFFLFHCIIENHLVYADQQKLVEIEKSLKGIIEEINHEENLSRKSSLNSNLLDLFEIALMVEGSFYYPFDSLYNIGKLQSQDKRIRVFTWNIPQNGGFQQYFGFVMYNNQESITIHKLTDARKDYTKPHLEKGSANKWYGALYYDLIEVDYNNKRYYTLLGVDFNNLFSSKRIIDVIGIDDNLEISFGYPLFRIHNNFLYRIIFEYSSRATMTLRWEKEHKLIVYNHLIPLRPEYSGNYQFYVPDLSFDGFMFNDSYWEYVPDIDIRNPSREKASGLVQPPTENFDPGFFYRSGTSNSQR